MLVLDFHVEIIWPGENLVAEGAVLVFIAHVIYLVDHGPDHRILVKDDLCNEMLIGQICRAQVEMSWLAN